MPTGHVSKAHKILGTVDINTGAPACSTGDSASVSEINLSVSETTYSYDDVTLGLLNSAEEEKEAGDKKLHDDVSSEILSEGAEGVTSGGDDSEIIPKAFETLNSTTGDDASSMRRKRLSTSTIASFYDKSKVPLSVSQQTSSSAIAKGPPPPTTQLVTDEALDLTRKKKKPARLDFSQLLPLRPSKPSSKNLVLGPDMMTKSSSPMSGASEAVPSPAMPETVEASEKGTSESPRENTVIMAEVSSSRHGGKATNIGGVRCLYDHYERTTLRSIMDEDTEELEPPISPQHDHLDQHMSHESAEPVMTNSETLSLAQQPEANPGEAGPKGAAGVNDGGGDFPGRISGKHERTSMLTNQSCSAQPDLNEKSVLLLSDDSDDDSKPAVASSKSVSFPLEGMNASRPAGGKPIVAGKRPTRMRPVSHHFFSPPPFNPPTTSLPEIPKDATRRATLASDLTKPQWSWSRASVNTSSSRESIPNRTSRTLPSPACSIAEVKPWRLSAKQIAQSRNSSSSILPQHLPQLAWPPTTRGSVYQHPYQNPTPPVSPCSRINFTSRKGSTENHGDWRYMAVTKQEEMLLSALRKKRRDMREAKLAEFRHSCVGGRARSCHGRDVSTSSDGIAKLDWTTSPAGRRYKSIDGFSPSPWTPMDGPSETKHGRRRSSPARSPSHLTYATTPISDQASLRSPLTPDATTSTLYDQEDDSQACTSLVAPAVAGEKPKTSPAAPAAVGPANSFLPSHISLFKRYSIPSPQHLSFISPVRSSSGALEADRHERVLLYLDCAAEEGKETAGMFDREPSPDLGDLVDFCNTAASPTSPGSGLHAQKRLEIEQLNPKTATTELDGSEILGITDGEHILKCESLQEAPGGCKKQEREAEGLST